MKRSVKLFFKNILKRKESEWVSFRLQEIQVKAVEIHLTMKHQVLRNMKLRALIIFIIFFTFSCKEENKNKISVITMVDTTELIMRSVNYDKQQKQHLESKLIEARVNKKLSDSLLAINYSSYIGLPNGV